jgi:hypothetical protein
LSAEAFRLIIRKPGSPCDCQFLAGPLTAKQVKRDGYAFTRDPSKAWTFATWRKARNKAVILNDHMGWGDGAFTQPVPEVSA